MPRCEAETAGPSEAYSKHAATSARGSQRRSWAFFSSHQASWQPICLIQPNELNVSGFGTYSRPTYPL